jgi:hypothetical protein
MELTPTAEGIFAVLSEGGVETGRIAVDPQKDDAAGLAGRGWSSQAIAR